MTMRLRWIAEPGDFDLMIGSSAAAHIRLADAFALTN